MYSPNLKKYEAVQTNWAQRVSDRLFGTNYVGQANLENQQRADLQAAQNNYELQKATNINKYEWNVQGMTQAGINPLAASGGLSSVSSGPSQASSGSMSQGSIGQITQGIFSEVKDILKEVSPSTFIKDIKDIVKHG